MMTPFTYYGGKQSLAKRIVEMLPAHKLYCEPFCGGAAVFFTKPTSKIEVINDTNRELINFYEQVQRDFTSLEKEIRISLHSRDQYNDALHINKRPKLHSPIKRAWAIWVLANQSFAGMLDGSWGYDRTSNVIAKKLTNRKEGFSEELAIRLQNVQIECTDAVRIIRSRDCADALFYCDPPYHNSDCGHYDGYTVEDFERLLDELSKIEGKFLLSSYPSPELKRAVEAHGWHQASVEQLVSVANNAATDKRKTKTEVFTANYDLFNPRLNDGSLTLGLQFE